MRDLFRLIGWTVVDLFRSRAVLEAEIWTLRQQISVLRRTAPKRVSFSVFDRLVFAGHYRLFPNICDALAKWFGVTSHPTAEWIANQLTEACGWEQAPRYLIRARDGAYG